MAVRCHDPRGPSRLGQLPPVGENRSGPSDRGCSHPAFSAGSSARFRLAWPTLKGLLDSRDAHLAEPGDGLR